MRQQALHNADVGDYRLVVTQAQIEVITCCHQYQHEHTQPEQQAPVAPLERIVLHVLGAKELVDVGGIYLYPKHFQRKALAFVRLAVDFHHKGRQVVERIVKRGQRVDHSTVYEAVALTLAAQLGALQHFNTRNELLRRLEDRKLCLSPFLHRGCHRDMHLLANEHLDRVDGCHDGDLRPNGQYRRCQ